MQSADKKVEARRHYLLAALYVLFGSIAALQSIAAHLHHPLLVDAFFGLILAGFVSILLFVPWRPTIQRKFSTLWPWLALLAVMAAADVHRYDITIHSPNPLTTGLALSEPGRALLHGHDPYSVRLPGDAPVSPGPGWIMLMLPFAFGSSLGLFNAVVLALVAALVWQRTRFGAVTVVLLSLAEPMFIAEASHGQDLFAISFVLAALCMLLSRVRPSPRNMVLVGLLAGFISTSRIPIILLVLLIAAGFRKRTPRAARLFALVASTTCAFLHTSFAIWSWHSGHRYPPLHLAGRATEQGGVEFMAAAVLMSGAAALWVLRRMDATPESWMLACWFVMTLLFAPAGIKELINSGFNWAWEGDNYVSFALPLLITAIALRARKEYPAIAGNTGRLNDQHRLQSASHRWDVLR